MNNPNPFSKYIFTYYDLSITFKFCVNKWRISTFSNSSKEEQSSAKIRTIEIALDMLVYAHQMRHEITKNLIIRCATCNQKLVVYPMDTNFDFSNIFDHYIHHKSRPFTKQYDKYFMCGNLDYCPFAKRMSCSTCEYDIEYEYDNYNGMLILNDRRVAKETHKQVIKHLTDHSTQVKNTAVMLLADKNSPFHMFDEYIMKNILVHCASNIKRATSYY